MSLATKIRWHWKTAGDDLIKPQLAPEWVPLIRELHAHGNSIMYIHNATGIEPATIRAVIKRITFRCIQ